MLTGRSDVCRGIGLVLRFGNNAEAKSFSESRLNATGTASWISTGNAFAHSQVSAGPSIASTCAETHTSSSLTTITRVRQLWATGYSGHRPYDARCSTGFSKSSRTLRMVDFSLVKTSPSSVTSWRKFDMYPFFSTGSM